MRTDKQLQKDVIAELQCDPVLPASKIAVSIRNGVVTLSGVVSSYLNKLAAESAAKRVRGVTEVADFVEVRR